MKRSQQPQQLLCQHCKKEEEMGGTMSQEPVTAEPQLPRELWGPP